MIDSLLSIVAPHPCCSCGEINGPLCDNCKYDIVSGDDFAGCVACGGISARNGICNRCDVPYSRAWCVGERSGELRMLINSFKFENMYAAHRSLADLLDRRLEQLPPETVIVPIPTVAAHIRQRGYDHTLLVARRLEKARHLRISKCLYRRTSTRQRDASRAQRFSQAKQAFGVKGTLISDRPYLLVDDVITTGATMKYAAQALRDAGASDVWVAALARQPLD